MYKAPRGTFDILPAEQGYWGYVSQKALYICKTYGYKRLDTPTFEDAGLFVRSIGEDTDIVEKEMYSFEDRNKEILTLRPEGTAPVCRAYIQHGMHSLPQPVRLYYFADIFRYERPQAGRYRQHHQFGVEALGDSDPALDAEVIDIAWKLYANLGLSGLNLYLNSIGCGNCRPDYLNNLREYYSKHFKSLCSDCRRRFRLNPMRLLDCKNPSCIPYTEKAPRSTDYLCHDCSAHLQQLQELLKLLNLPYIMEHRLVRGLDYYTRTVFEIAPHSETAAQATIGGGGRYDNLIEQLGGKSTPAVGFATGIERIVLNLKKQNVEVSAITVPSVFIAYLGKEAKNEAIKLSSRLRKSGLSVTLAYGDRSLKAQLKQADSSGIHHALIIGDNEVKSGTVVLRYMDKGEQETLPQEKAIEALSNIGGESYLR